MLVSKKRGIKGRWISKKNVLLQPLREETVVPVAQQVEHIPFKDGVLGSNPS